VHLLILGRGKTGSLVAEIARERGHEITLLCAADNLNASALTAEKLRHVNVAVDFTTPQAVMGNIEACVNAGKDLLVGTTGWYGDLDKVRQMVEKKGTGFLTARTFRLESICFSRPRKLQRESCSITIRDKSSSVIMRKKRMRLRERLRLCKRLSVIRPARNWKSRRSARAMWWACMRSSSTHRMTQFISVTIRSRAADLQRVRCGQRNGLLERRAFSTLRIFGERLK
jgi:hypothetical protein